MKTLRTPDSCFENLSDYDFAPHYVMVDDSEGGELRVHYLDEGPKDADPILLLHGEPSWCYLYREIIPILTAAGHRVIAPDLPGFGRSDKPVSRTDYTYQRHVDWMQSVLDQLDLKNITLFCQDWGGLIGLRLVAAHPDRFARVAAAILCCLLVITTQGKVFVNGSNSHRKRRHSMSEEQSRAVLLRSCHRR